VNELYAVLPGDVDDASVPSGGNTYDRRISRGLAELGWQVHEIAAAGTWPRPDPAARADLARSLAEIPDGAVVLLDGLVACGVPDVIVPQAQRLRLAILVHLPLADETGLEPALAKKLDRGERETLRAATAVVATSRWAADRLTRQHELAPDRVHTVVPGTDPAPLATGTDGASRLLCVASVTPRKGHDLLIEALESVVELPWSCVCVGPMRRDPDYAERLLRLIVRQRLSGRIRLVGPRTGKPLEAAYSAADLVVLPSRAETYGMVVTEALARGIPVLASAVHGVPDTLGKTPDGEIPGILVPPADPKELAGGLRSWLDEPELRDRLRSYARRRRGMLSSWEDSARRMAVVLERVAS
jgi:glycosyltransferase involved in cell wall biosynthesis